MALAFIENVRTRVLAREKGLVCLLALLLMLPSLQAHSSEGVRCPRWGQCSAAGIPAPMEKGPKTVKKLADNVYWFSSPYFENTLIVVGDKGVLITDTFNDTHARLLREEIAKITDKPVTKVVLSHEHFDHIGGTQYFAGAEIIAQKNILPFLIFDPLNRAPDKIDVTFDAALTVDMGTTQIELKYWGQTEGVANAVIYLPKEGIALLSDLHPGDRSLIDILSLSDTNMLGLRLVLNEVSKWNLKYVLDSHTPNTDPKLLREYAVFMNDLHDAVFPIVKKESETADALELWYRLQFILPTAIKLPKYKDWTFYDEQLSSNVMWMATSILYGAL